MEHNTPFSGGPANGGPAPNQMSYSNGTPPAGDMGSVPPPSGGSPTDSPKTTLW